MMDYFNLATPQPKGTKTMKKQKTDEGKELLKGIFHYLIFNHYTGEDIIIMVIEIMEENADHLNKGA